MLSLPPQSCDVGAYDYISCSAAARAGSAAAAAAAAATVHCSASTQQQLNTSHHAGCAGQQYTHQQLQLGAKPTCQMSEESSAALSTGVSWHVSSGGSASPQDIKSNHVGGPASPSSGSTGAAYSAAAAPGTAVLPHLGSGLGPAWSPTNQPLQLQGQQQQRRAGNSSTTNLLQLQATYSGHHSGGSMQSVGQSMGQSGPGTVQYAAAGHASSMGRSSSVSYEAVGESFGQQGLGRSTPQQQLQLLQHQKLQLLLARQQATGPQLLPPMQQAAAAPQQLPVLLPMPLQAVLGAAQQQRQQQPRRTLVPLTPGDAPKGASMMLVLGSQPPKEASFEAGFEAGILQGLAQFTQQINSSSSSSLLPGGQAGHGPITALSAVSTAPMVPPGLGLRPAGSGVLGLKPAGLGVLNPAGVAQLPPAAVAGPTAAALAGATPASRVLLQAQIAQQQAARQQLLQQQAGALSRLGPKKGPAVRRGRKRRMRDEQPSTSAEAAAEVAREVVAEAPARPRASAVPAEAPAAANAPAAPAQTATVAVGTATVSAGTATVSAGTATAAAGTATAAAAAAAGPKLPSATSVAMCCSISDLLGVDSREQAALRLTSMSRSELFQFAAKALGLSCTTEQLSSAASEQGCAGAGAAASCCSPSCCTPAQMAAGCCSPAQIAAGCCAPASTCAPASNTGANLGRSSSGSVQYCTPEQLIEGCCTADDVATGRCILVPAVDSSSNPRAPVSAHGSAPAGTADAAKDINRSRSWPLALFTSQQQQQHVEARDGPSAPPAKRSCVSERPPAASAFAQAAASNPQGPHRSFATRAAPTAAAAGARGAAGGVPPVQRAASHPGALQHSTGAAAAADAARNLEPPSYMQMYMDWQQDGAFLDWLV